jgi:hypothetical protein
MDGDESAEDFSHSAYCCISFQPPVANNNHPKALAGSGYGY